MEIMNGIVSVVKLPTLIQKLKKQKESIVLAGGCFDVLHPGHVIFLEKAKAVGDVLIVLLESDLKVKKLKGISRPVHNQKERAQVLSALSRVDYIVMLPYMGKETSYDEIVLKIKPDIIAATKGNTNRHLKRAAKLVGAKLKYVTKLVGNHSSSRVLDRHR